VKGSVNIEGFIIITIFCSFILMFIIMIGMGCVEFTVAHRLRKHGENVEGYIEYVDLKSTRPGGVYGKVCFTYKVHDRTYTKKQTVDKDTAVAFLTGMPAASWLSKQQITVIFLPRRPSIARLAAAPSDRLRILNFVVALIVLGFIVALMLISILVYINSYPSY
jgi:hypothetical protein